MMGKTMTGKTMTGKARMMLGVEALLLLGVVPLLVLALRERGVMLAVLWLGAAGTGYYLYRGGWRPEHGEGRPGLRAVVLRFAILAPVIFLVAWWCLPAEFLSLPAERTRLWLAIMLLYPLLSVLPQEIIYRAFIFERYAPLWGRAGGYIAASALAFGYMHILFLNVQAIVMTAILGFILARDYARHRSLGLVCVEHALYGCLIFTVGFGRFFYSGAAWGGG